MSATTTTRAVILSALTTLLTTTAGAQVGDLCDDPIAQQGSGTVSIDMSLMQAASGGWADAECFPSNPQHEIDAWICWTSDVDGLVEISTCGTTQMDTQLALFAGCACPTELSQPLCCSDNSCDKQTLIRCDVVCGERYMILVSTTDLGGGPGVDVNITPIDEPCPPQGEHELIDCEDCCGAVPEVTGFGGLQAIASQWREPTADDPYVLHVFDLDPAGLAPDGSVSSPPTYEHPDWTLDTLGTVFGVAMSGDGTMYAAATRIYAMDFTGSLGDSGSIYRLDGTTGAPSELISLPNDSMSGLGNIAASCPTGILYASNFDDGLIWAVDASGNPVDAYRHVDGVVVGPLGDPNDVDGIARLGERPWAVQPVGDRLYYSVWVEDGTRVDPDRNNEVWSVGLDPSGQFLAGTRQFEFSTPDWVWSGFPANATSPISDIAQGPDCCLYLAERTMTGDGTTGSHDSRVLVACQNEDGTWTIDDTRFQIGVSLLGSSAAGGIAVDHLDDGRIWATGDAVGFATAEFTYGIQGTPQTGGGPDESVKIDLDDDITQQDKSGIGSIDITCIIGDSGPCATAATYDTVECVVDENGPTGDYIVHVELQNLSGHEVQYLLVPGGQASPAMVPFNPPLVDGGSITIDFTLTGAPFDLVCIPMILFDADGQECCTVELCVELPECTCASFAEFTIDCAPDGSGDYVMDFVVTNLTADVIEHVFVLPLVGSGDVITPAYFDIPPMAPWSSVAIGPVTLSTSVPAGDQHAVNIALHNATLKECCSVPLVFEVPDCGEGSTFGDLDGNGTVDGADLTVLLGAWGSGGPGDLNGDGVVDGADLAILLATWAP